MAHFSIDATGVTTGATAGTFTTVLGIKMPNTPGARRGCGGSRSAGRPPPRRTSRSITACSGATTPRMARPARR